MLPIAPRTRQGLALAALLLSAACADPTVTGLARQDAARDVAHAARDAHAAAAPTCRPDAKLIGRIALSTRDEPGTWWYLTRSGLDASGVVDYRAAISEEFGVAFATLDDAVAHLVAAVRSLDANQNGFVCAYEGRGTLGRSTDPDFWLTHFLVRDDKHAQP